MLQSGTIMNDKQVGSAGADAEKQSPPGFFRRYRLPLLLGLIAIGLYLGSILYILFGRGSIT